MACRASRGYRVGIGDPRTNKHPKDWARSLLIMAGMRAEDSWTAFNSRGHVDDRHHSFFYETGDAFGTSTFRIGSLQGRRNSAALLVPNASGSLRVALSIGETSSDERDRILKWAQLAESGPAVQVSDGQQIVPLGAAGKLNGGKGGIYLRLALGERANCWLYVGLDQARDLQFPPFDGEHACQYSPEWVSVVAAMLCLESARSATEGSGRRLPLTGSCQRMQQVFAKIERFGNSDVSILIHGETGTGKELVAKSLHLCSRRAKKPFVALNCGGLRGDTLRSELFGHKRGAFTGAVSNQTGKFREADGGTLFLDEIGDMPLETQELLLRALQERKAAVVGGQDVEFDVRLICATHRSLPELIEKGIFRQDLYFRVKVAEIELPPLRERGNDILELADALLERCGIEEGRTTRGFTPDACAALVSYGWPGNVRELENVVRQGLVNAATGSAISAEDLDLPPAAATRSEPQRPVHAPPPSQVPAAREMLNEAQFRRFLSKFIANLQPRGGSEDAVRMAVERALRPAETRGRACAWIAVARELLALPAPYRGRENQLSETEAVALAERIVRGVTGVPSVEAVARSAATLLRGSDRGIYDLIHRIRGESISDPSVAVPPNSEQPNRARRPEKKGHLS